MRRYFEKNNDVDLSVPLAIARQIREEITWSLARSKKKMGADELATMREQDVDIRILLVRNNYLGLVREFQHYHYDSHYEGVELGRWPDYGKIAEAYGLPYNEVSSNSELDEKLNWLLEGDGARMLVCDVDSENNVK